MTCARPHPAAAYAREIALALLSALVAEQDAQHEILFGCQLVERSHRDALRDLDEAHLTKIHVRLARVDALNVHRYALAMQTFLYRLRFVLGHRQQEQLTDTFAQLIQAVRQHGERGGTYLIWESHAPILASDFAAWLSSSSAKPTN